MIQKMDTVVFLSNACFIIWVYTLGSPKSETNQSTNNNNKSETIYFIEYQLCIGPYMTMWKSQNITFFLNKEFNFSLGRNLTYTRNSKR